MSSIVFLKFVKSFLACLTVEQLENVTVVRRISRNDFAFVILVVHVEVEFLWSKNPIIATEMIE